MFVRYLQTPHVVYTLSFVAYSSYIPHCSQESLHACKLKLLLIGASLLIYWSVTQFVVWLFFLPYASYSMCSGLSLLWLIKDVTYWFLYFYSKESSHFHLLIIYTGYIDGLDIPILFLSNQNRTCKSLLYRLVMHSLAKKLFLISRQ